MHLQIDLTLCASNEHLSFGSLPIHFVGYRFGLCSGTTNAVIDLSVKRIYIYIMHNFTSLRTREFSGEGYYYTREQYPCIVSYMRV